MKRTTEKMSAKHVIKNFVNKIQRTVKIQQEETNNPIKMKAKN